MLEPRQRGVQPLRTPVGIVLRTLQGFLGVALCGRIELDLASQPLHPRGRGETALFENQISFQLDRRLTFAEADLTQMGSRVGDAAIEIGDLRLYGQRVPAQPDKIVRNLALEGRIAELEHDLAFRHVIAIAEMDFGNRTVFGRRERRGRHVDDHAGHRDFRSKAFVSGLTQHDAVGVERRYERA